MIPTPLAWFRAVLLAGALTAIGGFEADAAPRNAGPASPAKGPEADTEHIFGFTEGSDIGDKGELEGETETTGGLGKRSGRYAALSQTMQLKYSITDYFRIAPALLLSRHDIAGVPDFDDRRELAFQGAGVELRYRLVNRDKAPVGMSLSFFPTWGRRDSGTGQPVRQFSGQLVALFDRELLEDRVFAAFNVIYDPSWTRLRATGETQASSTFGLGGAVTYRVMPHLFLGAELRYLRAYEGATLNVFAGQGLFMGPTLFWIVTERANLTLAWNAQVAGKAVDDPARLDLVNFDRHRVRLRLGYTF